MKNLFRRQFSFSFCDDLKRKQIKFSAHFKVKVGPKGEYSEPISQNNRIFIVTPNGYVVVYNDKGQFLWEVRILPEGTKAKNKIFGKLGGCQRL